jgi:regulator of replication initiation timing
MIELSADLDEMADSLFLFGVIGLIHENEELEAENKKLKEELAQYRKKGGLIPPLTFD